MTNVLIMFLGITNNYGSEYTLAAIASVWHFILYRLIMTGGFLILVPIDFLVAMAVVPALLLAVIAATKRV